LEAAKRGVSNLGKVDPVVLEETKLKLKSLDKSTRGNVKKKLLNFNKNMLALIETEEYKKE